MKNPNEGDLFGGLARPELACDNFDLGGGLSIRRTYARLMAPFLISSREPSPDNPVGTPVRDVPNTLGFHISAVVCVPSSFRPPDLLDKVNTAWILVALLRMTAGPRLLLPLFADKPFELISESGGEDIQFWCYESSNRQLRLGSTGNDYRIETNHLEWVRDNWVNAARLVAQYPVFNLALQAFDRIRWAHTETLGLLQAWTALESIFSVGHGELRFRISAHIASFLEKRGPERLSEQKRVAKLYDARSAAAHGKDENAERPLVDSYQLLRSILIKTIETGHVPNRESMEIDLFT